MKATHVGLAARMDVAVGVCLLLACGGCAGSRATQKNDATLEVPGNAGDLTSVQATTTDANAKPTRVAKGRARPPTKRESAVIAELMEAAARVRGLRFEHDVPVVVEDRERITDYVESEIEEDELERERVVYIALGLLAPELDVRSLLLRVMGEQVVGYYDPEAGRLAVRDDVMEAFARASDDDESSDLIEARTVLVHELVHALQDQNLSLSQHVKQTRDTDADNAFHALVEGDATLAMYGYALEREQIPLHKVTGNPAMVRSFSDAVRHSPLAGSELEQAPPIVRVPLLSAYVDGLAFCASLHGSAGWAAVDRAHAKPPISTEQVLHPERFARGELPQTLLLPKLSAVEDAGYHAVQDDTLGELEIGVYFGQGATETEARRAADGWNGDRLRVYTKDGSLPAVVWVTLWDSVEDALDAARAAERVRTLGPEAERALGEVVRKGRAVLILRDLPDDVRSELRSAFSETGLAPAASH